ncbi:conserved exported hypothetical protein [metagenome]|uniref:Phosphatidic acid phosphatase type 2/haloperoxidase domain-containing protein n=1 Tax=metagenome TaxID=256318 RepID=A0A2P2C3I7_9ZZZZ
MTPHSHPRTRTLAALAAAVPTALALILTVPTSTVASMPARPVTAPAAGPSQVVLDWERTSFRTVFTEAVSPIPVGTLYLGFTSLAMNDAVHRARHHHGSRVAAVAQAAHDVLAEYFPASLAALDADLATSLDALPGNRFTHRGIDAGAAAADAMIASRVDDGRDDASVVYIRDEAPGVWQPAEGGTMLAAWLGYVDPLVLHRRVWVNGPDALTSRDYARDYNEVRRLGSATSTARTATQTDTALFFNSNSAIMIGEALIARLESRPLSLRRTALLFAAMHGAMADSVITCWRLKYEVGFWRPAQAVAGAETDGNPATHTEADWTSLLPLPPYSDYISGHASLTGSAAAVVRRMLGDRTRLTLHSYNTGTDRTYARLSRLEAGALNSRIWGGLHFRDAMNDGYRVAHRTGARVLAHLR